MAKFEKEFINIVLFLDLTVDKIHITVTKNISTVSILQTFKRENWGRKIFALNNGLNAIVRFYFTFYSFFNIIYS